MYTDNEAQVESPPSVTPDLTCLADVTPEPVRWLWERRIQLGQLTLLVGRPGAGKTFVVCDIAARVSGGRPWPDDGGATPAPTGDVILIATEDGVADTLLPRIKAAGGNPARVHVLRTVTRTQEDGTEVKEPFTLSHLDVLRQAVDRLDQAALIVIDPIGSHLKNRRLAPGTDPDRSRPVRNARESGLPLSMGYTLGRENLSRRQRLGIIPADKKPHRPENLNHSRGAQLWPASRRTRTATSPSSSSPATRSDGPSAWARSPRRWGTN